MTPQEARTEIVEYIKSLQQRNYNYKDIAMKCNAKGYETVNGKEWNKTSVSRLIKDPEYFITFNKASTEKKQKISYVKPYEQRKEVHDLIVSLKEQGKTITEITKSLNNDGYTGINGGRFYTTTVSNIIENPNLLLFDEKQGYVSDKVTNIHYSSDEKQAVFRVTSKGDYVIIKRGEVLHRTDNYKEATKKLEEFV